MAPELNLLPNSSHYILGLCPPVLPRHEEQREVARQVPEFIRACFTNPGNAEPCPPQATVPLVARQSAADSSILAEQSPI